ncbi:hypothetical protein [Alkaliphilus sp. B6464]|uniref:hypothetical protein n=1 Tax=Alkaliphilus sp. B6464 TaxID=2731219 RepID=UPI001BAAF1EF|nr:hypothetical protein [Alkaliphilus sp. B6464]QUH21960.1 hypothetical protein HYG84_18815 [Alkaliphilus sp. B6464]
MKKTIHGFNQVTGQGTVSYLKSHVESLQDRIDQGDVRAKLYEEQVMVFNKAIEMCEGNIKRSNELTTNDIYESLKQLANQLNSINCGRNCDGCSLRKIVFSETNIRLGTINSYQICDMLRRIRTYC